MTGPAPVRVLIADDHPPTRDDVRRALAGDDRFEVCATVANAAAAIAAAVRERPDVCLLDIHMPGGGVAAAWEITARLPQAKIVMLTVSGSDEDLFASLRAGAHGYLMKTIDLRCLPSELAGVCSGEAPMQRTLVARVLERFHSREPRWRHLAGGQTLQQRLTSREWQVLDLLAQGLSTAEIARALVLSTGAVRVHIASVVHKLNVSGRSEAAELFRRGAGT